MVEKLTKPSVVKAIIDKYDFKISKSLGQNFLVDDGIRQKIVASGELAPDQVVVEIGPGLGTLTQALAEEGCRVIAVELDKRMIPILKENLSPYKQVQIINQDILAVDLDRLVQELTGEDHYKVLANLPYYITTPVIMHLLESRYCIDLLVLMMQKEVAERVVAKPGTKAYGRLSVVVQYFTNPELVVKVPKTVFMPRPEVESAVVRFIRRENPPVLLEDEGTFFKIVRAAFHQRRKTLRNSLCGQDTGLDKQEAIGILLQAEIDGQRRGETLSLEELARLSNIYHAATVCKTSTSTK